MGLDITIIEYLGKDDKGYLKTKCPDEELPYTTDRYTIRHKIMSNIEMETLSSGKYYDAEEYHRPVNFDEAYNWCNSIEDEGSRNYVQLLFDSLIMNDNYYLNYEY